MPGRILMMCWPCGLLQKFHPDFTKAEIAFTDENRQLFRRATAIGISRGQFDEHKGDEGECAATLVWKWLKIQPELTFSARETMALERILDWALKKTLAN